MNATCSFCQRSQVPADLALRCGWKEGPHFHPTGKGVGPTVYCCAKPQCRVQLAEYDAWWRELFSGEGPGLQDLTVAAWRMQSTEEV